MLSLLLELFAVLAELLYDVLLLYEVLLLTEALFEALALVLVVSGAAMVAPGTGVVIVVVVPASVEDLVVWLQPLKIRPRSAETNTVFFIGD